MSSFSRGDSAEHSNASQASDQVMIGELADCILDVLKADVQQDIEPFENYAHALRLRLQVKTKFRERCIQGYEALLETLQAMP